MKHVVKTFVAVLAFVTSIVCAEKTLYQKIGQHNMASLEWVEQEWPNEEFRAYLKRCIEYQKYPTEAQKRRITFKLLGHYHKLYPIADGQVLADSTTWHDINLFCGKQHKDIYLADILDRTQTHIGKGYLFGMLATPQTDIMVLHRRQSVVRELIENKKLYQQLNDILCEIARAETIMLSFWGFAESDKLFSAAQSHYFSFPLLKKFTHSLNKNQWLLEINNRIGHKRRFMFFITSVLAAAILPAYGAMCLFDFDCPALFNLVVEKLRGAGGRMLSLLSLIDNRFVLAGTSITAGAYCALNCQYEYVLAVDELLLDDLLQEKMVGVAEYIRAVKKLEQLIESNNALFNGLEKNGHLVHFASSSSKSVKRLVALLNKQTFAKKAKIFFLHGRVLAAYYLLHEIKDELLPVLASVGEIDTYLSIAKLYEEFENKRVHFSFAQFKQADNPYIELENFWNPFVDCKSVVPSSIVLGGGVPQNGIITGPNAAGKSTILHAIVINLLLAQTFGIAPADKIIVTPFTKIASYCNVTDDIAAGNSLFKAQVIRAQQLINRIESLLKHEFSFVVIDEMFNSTSDIEGKAIAYAVAQRFGEFQNSVCMIATHFDQLVRLATEKNTFTNYKVGVEKRVDGSLYYPFALEKGISNQHIALDILRDQGLGHTMINKAEQLMKQIKKEK